MDRKKLLSIFLIVLVDVIGFSILIPLLPEYAKMYSTDALTVGLLLSSYSLMQMIGAPIFGRLSDRVGRRPVLFLSTLGTAIGLQIFAWGTVLPVLFLGRIIDGITGGNFSVAQAYIADITDEKNRAKGMGVVGAAFGLGFIIGPVLSIFTKQFGLAFPIHCATALALINLFNIWRWLPESLSPERRAELVKKPFHFFNLALLRQSWARPRVGALLAIRAQFGITFGTFEGVFPTWARDRFGFTPDVSGRYLAYMGAWLVAFQGGLMGRIARRFSEDAIIFWSFVLQAATLAAWAFTPAPRWLFLTLIPIALVSSLLNTIIRSALSRACAEEDVGEIMGLGASLGSFARTVMPPLAGLLIDLTHDLRSPGIAGALLTIPCLFYIATRLDPFGLKTPPPASQDPRLL